MNDTLTVSECLSSDSIIVSSENDQHLAGQYDMVHKSSIGTKYLNAAKDIKITYSTKVNNFLNGKWRWAKNSSPYTLYYANSNTTSCVPTNNWLSFEGDVFVGTLSEPGLTIEYDVYRRCTFELTPTPTLSPTPTPTPTLQLPYDVYRRCDIQLPPTPLPTPFPVPVDELPPYDPPAGIIRHELTERVWVKAVPTVTWLSRHSIQSINTPKKVTLYGYSINHTDQVFLSGSQDVVGEHQLVDMFSHIPSLSADFPSFYGVPIDFVIKNENVIDIYIPALHGAGTVDIIIQNRAGYSSLNPPYVFSQWSDYNLQNYLISVE